MKHAVLTLFLVLVFTSLTAAATVLPIGERAAADPLTVDLVSSGDAGVTVDLAVSGLIAEPLLGAGAGHVALSWENGGVEGIVGEPALPVRRLVVALPYGATVRPSVIAESWVERGLQAWAGSSALAPVQPPREKREGAVVPFTKKASAYARTGYGNAPVVEVNDIVVMRGQTLALVTVRPVQYDPAAGTVRVASELRVRMDFVGGDAALTDAKRARYHDLRTANLFGEAVINPVTDDLDELPATLGYLVIAADNAQWLATLDPYLLWKQAQGYEVTVTTTGDIGSSLAEIKDYIQTAYDTWDVPPSHILLVGDTGDIPCWTGQGTGSPNTDLNYVQLEGTDYFADAGIGRFSIANVEDLQNVIDKTMHYEKVLWDQGNQDWVTHQVFMASVDNYQVSEGTHNFVLNNYLLPAGFTADLLYQVTYGADTDDTIAAFNAGTNLGTYSGHGSETSWADGPPLNQGQVEALSNTVYPFVQSYACVTGSFHIPECFAETWMRTSSGAFAFMGSSVNSYWDEDDIMEKKVYEAFFDNQTPNDPYHITWINGMVDYSKIKLWEHYGNTGMVRRYFEMYNIMGDGSVDLWTTVPQTVTVNHPAAFFLGMTEVEVSVPDAPTWAKVCVMSTAQPEIIASGYVNDAGVCSLTLPEAPTLPGMLKIVVTGHNIDPYEAEVPITAADGPYVVYESVTVNDAGGWNPNGILDYDESALLSVTVQNVGVDPTQDPTSVQLTDVAGMVGFSDNAENYPSIPADQSVTVDDGFALSVDAGVADGSVANVPVFIADSWDFWESVMPLTLAAPVQVVTDVVFDDSDGGNGNNWLDPGENAWITVTMTNEGSSPLIEGNALLHSNGDPYVDIITDNVETFDVLEPGASVEMGWGIMATANCPQDYAVTLQLDVDADHGWQQSSDVAITVGDILFAPTGPDGHGYLAYDPNDGLEALPYNWVEISPTNGGPGTDTGIDGDDETVHFTLPFTFTYYGQDFTEYTVDSNGNISLGTSTPSSDYSNSQIPNADGPGAMIAPFWEDLNPSRNGCDGIYYWHDTVQHRLIVEWSEIDEYTPQGTFETFQVILYDPAFHPTSTGDGIIQFQYLDISDEIESSVTVGIENPDENDGLQLVYDGEWDVHMSPITSGTSVTIVAGTTTLLPAPTDLTAEVATNGEVDLAWSFPGMYTLEQLTAPQAGQPGDKPDQVRPEDAAQLANWEQNGVPTSELDELLNFRVYRDNTLVGEPVDMTFTDDLPEHGDYTYMVSALHDEGESLPCDPVMVSWDPLVTLEVTGLNTTVPGGGGVVTYGVHLTSITQTPYPGANYWTMITLPNDNVVGPVFQTTFTLPANADMNVSPIAQTVPGMAPGGFYLHSSYVGLYPNLIAAHDDFMFIKSGQGQADGTIDLSEWTVSGWQVEEGATVAAEDARVLPEQFEVGAAYPNPFNPTVTVPVALPERGELQVTLVNLLGQRVLELNQVREAGHHTVMLDCSALSSGLYLLQVRGAGQQVTQKVMMLK